MSDAGKAVFLSYASQDTAAARKICEALRTAGVEVWFDQSELRGGDAWDQKIRRQIRECALFVPIISASTQARGEGYFRLEWKLAVDRSHLMAEDTAFIFPVVVDDVSNAAARVPDKFRELQWTRLRLDETPTELAARVRRLLASDPETERPRLVGRGEAAAPARKKQPTWARTAWTLVGLAFAVTFLVRPFFRSSRHSPEDISKIVADARKAAAEATKVAMAKSGTPEAPPSEIRQVAAKAEELAAPANDKSVAVLAFANLSGDKDNEYFSDGISEELLTALQKIPGLHVAARTSSFSFKGRDATTQEIGAKLGVANVVEGSVQKSGTRVKVSVHLSRAATGEDVWSETYTRELKDVFVLQEELTRAIVGELRGQLTGGDVAAVKAAVKGGTTNAEAFQLYLQGLYYSNRFAEKALLESIGYYQRAVDLDPSFALAWAELAQSHLWLCEFSGTIDRKGFDEHLGLARAAAGRALALEPQLVSGLLARALIQANVDYDWKGAAQSLQAALALAPADPKIVTASGNLAGALGNDALAVARFREAVALDPVNPLARSFLAFGYVTTRQFAEAEAEYGRLAALNPTIPWAYAGLGLAYVLQGKFDQAFTTSQQDAADWARLLITALARFGQKRMPEADAALAELKAKYAGTAAYQVAEIHAYRGEKDLAFEWLDRARQQRDGGMLGLMTDPLLVNLKPGPRWPAFLRQLGLTEPPAR